LKDWTKHIKDFSEEIRIKKRQDFPDLKDKIK